MFRYLPNTPGSSLETIVMRAGPTEPRARGRAAVEDPGSAAIAAALRVGQEEPEEVLDENVSRKDRRVRGRAGGAVRLGHSASS